MNNNEMLLSYIQDLVIRLQSLKSRVAIVKEGGYLKTVSGNLVTIKDAIPDKPFTQLKVDIAPVQSGSGDPSPENIRPITGYTEVVTYRRGKNMGRLSNEITSSSRTQNGITSTPIAGKVDVVHLEGLSTGTYYLTTAQTFAECKAQGKLLKAGTYVFSTNLPDLDNNTNAYIVGFDIYGNSLSGSVVTQVKANKPKSFTIVEDIYYNIQATIPSGKTINQDVWFQIETGTTATEYKSYQGNIYTIALGQTVYGGTLDVVAGVLKVTKGYALLNDASKWITSTGTTDFKYTENFDRKLYADSYTGLQCTCFKVDSTDTLRSARWVGASSLNFGIKWSNITLEELQTMTSNNEIAICYDIEPQTIQLTPQEVKTLLGDNNVWTDVGNVEVTYRAKFI